METSTTVMTMQQVISAIGDVFNGALGWASTVANTVTGITFFNRR